MIIVRVNTYFPHIYLRIFRRFASRCPENCIVAGAVFAWKSFVKASNFDKDVGCGTGRKPAPAYEVRERKTQVGDLRQPKEAYKLRVICITLSAGWRTKYE